MKKIIIFFLLITILISFQCKKDKIPDDPPIPGIIPPKIISFYEVYSFERYSFNKMKYKGNRFDYAVCSGDTIKFTYKNNRLDSYIGPMFGSCCDVNFRKQYHYINDSLIDRIWFKSTYKDDELENIELKYNAANQINYYRLQHSLDPYPYYLYEWTGDDITKVTTYNYNYHVTPVTVVQSIDCYTYSDTINPLQSLKTIYFKSIFLNKHLPKSMTRIRYEYDYDNNNSPITRTLAKIDTLHFNYSFDYSNSGLVTNIYMNNQKHFNIRYDK
jgi:hypothetical protein